MSSIDKVISCGSCVGCGACEVATGGKVFVQLTSRQTYEAVLPLDDPLTLDQASEVCPFSDESPDEDEVASTVFGGELALDPRLGRHLSSYAGRISDDSAITGSSSGGLTTFLLRQLLGGGHVDGVIHVGSGDDVLFEYVVSRSDTELVSRRKSQYFPVNFADVLQAVRGDGKKYAFVGIPCAAKAVRHLTAQDPVLRDQIAFVVGIVCGHLKSMAYAESFAWQLGIAPDQLAAVDFRVKDPARTSREYGFRATSESGASAESKTLSLVGGSWGHAVFQLGACDYCDDIFAETADVVLGDAWLAKYEIDWRGTNVVLTRNLVIDTILRDGAARGEVVLDELSPDSVAATQGGNFRHRREGLAVRLHDDHAGGRWTPRKRVQPSVDEVTPERASLIRRRRAISVASHDLFVRARQSKDLAVYLDGIRPMITAYQDDTKMSFRTRVVNKAKRETWKLWGRLRNARASRSSR